MPNATIHHNYLDGTTISTTPTAETNPLEGTKHRLRHQKDGTWRIIQTRWRTPAAHRIKDLTKALKDAGYHTVEHDLSFHVPDYAIVEALRAEHIDELTAKKIRHAEITRRHADEVTQKEAEAIANDNTPLGQPLLTDHHSYPSRLSSIEKSRRHLSQTVEAQQEAREAERVAREAVASASLRTKPEHVKNRLESLKRRLRAHNNVLGSMLKYEKDELLVKCWKAQIVDVEKQIAYWESVWAQFPEVEPLPGLNNLKPGMFVVVFNVRCEVVKVNKKSVKVRVPLNSRGSAYMEQNAPFDRISEVLLGDGE